MIDTENYAVIIPARFKSTRLPGKPLIDLCGKPMIQHVWEKCCNAVGEEKVYIATDDQIISSVVEKFGGNVVMTSHLCLTGTDRIAEANEKLGFDFVINVQGDEPLIDPAHILQVKNAYLGSNKIINAMCKIQTEEEFHSITVPKVVFDNKMNLMYMSRAGIPLNKTGKFDFAFKQVCIYAFSKEHLSFFKENGAKSQMEAIEDIEILRFLEAGYSIEMLEVGSGSIAVDIPQDVEKVKKVLTAVSS